MKKLFPVLFNCCLFFTSEYAIGQGGTWTWMNGDTLPVTISIHGAAGQFDSLFHPNSYYERNSWKDNLGNFWYMMNGDSLWKFDPANNKWAWINGSGTSTNYGIKGISSPLNSPGRRDLCALTWADTSGMLWIYGGLTSAGFTADLWKYDITTNEWTWVSGNNIPNDPGQMGVQGIPSVNNYPGLRAEVSAAWVDSASNTLWFYGGQTAYNTGSSDLWKYDIATNEWTWMKGDTTSYELPQYNTIKVADPTNTPGGRGTYCKWTDNNGDFWLFGGWDWLPGTNYNDVWRYEKSTNSWACMNVRFSNCNAVGNCMEDSTNIPSKAEENKLCWKDLCGKFWTFYTYNLLWELNPVTSNWSLYRGSCISGVTCHYGIKEVADTANFPQFYTGAEGWTDKDGNFWYFQELNSVMWKFTPDLFCSGCILLPAIAFNASPDSICPGNCIGFNNTTLYATDYHWHFPGATPDTTTAPAPQNICYATPGSYDVQLIASNANGSDTLLLTNYITVYPSPPPQSITQSGDTLFAIAGSASYQWYFNTNIINGATDYFYVAQASGDYNVVATDVDGCEVEAAIFNVVAGMQSTVDSEPWTIFPNPVEDKVKIYKSEVKSLTAPEISIYNVIGEMVLAAPLPTAYCLLPTFQIDVANLPSGLYYIEIISCGKTFRSKFVKQ